MCVMLCFNDRTSQSFYMADASAKQAAPAKAGTTIKSILTRLINIWPI